MWIFGAVDFTAALAKVAKVLGYRVTVVRRPGDLRHPPPLPDGRRGRRVVAGAGVRAARRDARADVTRCASSPTTRSSTSRRCRARVATDVGYIGVMGSRTTHDKRLERLLEAGVDSDDLDRLMSPIGLDLGARTPEETAISICAEIIATRTGKTAPQPQGLRGPDPRLNAASVRRFRPDRAESKDRTRACQPVGSPKRTDAADEAQLDVGRGVGGVDDGVADAEVHHHVARGTARGRRRRPRPGRGARRR